MERLREHGILKEEEVYKEYYMSLRQRIADTNDQSKKLKALLSENITQGTMTISGGLSSQQQAQAGANQRSKIKVYFFNIDLMYILKARLIVLGQQLKEKLEQRVVRGTTYKCPNRNCQYRNKEIDEVE